MMILFLLTIFVSNIDIFVAEDNIHCPAVNLTNTPGFDFYKDQKGIWYLTHMSNYSLSHHKLTCTTKKLKVNEDSTISCFFILGAEITAEISKLTLTANVNFTTENKRNFTLHFNEGKHWHIGPVYIVDTDFDVYTLHWQCFFYEHHVANFLLYSRKKTIDDDIVEKLNKKLPLFIPGYDMKLEPITQCPKDY